MTQTLTKLLRIPTGARPIGSPGLIRIELNADSDEGNRQKIIRGKVSKVRRSAPATANAYSLGRVSSEALLRNYRASLFDSEYYKVVFFPVQYYKI